MASPLAAPSGFNSPPPNPAPLDPTANIRTTQVQTTTAASASGTGQKQATTTAPAAHREGGIRQRLLSAHREGGIRQRLIRAHREGGIRQHLHSVALQIAEERLPGSETGHGHVATTAPAAYREGGMRHRLLSLALRLAGPKAPLPETTSSAAPGVHGKDEDIPPIKAAASILPIILEAEKRGITVRLKGPTSYSLSLAGKTFDCVKSLTPLASPAAVELCNDRDKTFEFLTSIHIPVPSYIVFAPDNPNAAIKFMNDNTSVVVKPSKDSSGGKGVSVDVSTEPGLKRAIAYTQDEIRKNSSDADVRIEKFYKGTDYRLLVIDSKLVAAGELTPASVVGDGASTIEMLIQEREKSGKPILNDDEAKRCLEMQKLSYDSIPEKGMTVQVRNNANTATGGSMKDVTKELPQYLRDVSEHIAKELFAKESNLPVLGIDVRVEAPGKYVVIELSADPTLSTLNRYQPDVVPRYIDTMFPNTAEDHPEALPQ